MHLQMPAEGIKKINPCVPATFILAAGVLAVFWQTGGFDFIRSYDDQEYILANEAIRDGITPQSLIWAFTTFYAANWHPLTWISHMADIQLYGLNPAGHHLTNVILHLLNALLLFHLLLRSTRSVGRSLAVAALFALHPLHVESVAMVAERKDVLSTFFWMVTLHFYITYTAIKGRGRYLMTLGAFTLGLLSKPMVVSLPFVLLLFDFWPLQRWRSAAESGGSNADRHEAVFSLVLEKVPFLLLAAATGTITVLAQHSLGATDSMAVYPFFHRLANALVSCAAYLVKTIWPHPLVVFYPYRETIAAWQWIGAAGLIVAVTAVALIHGRKRGYLICGWFWYLVTLVPVIGLVQVGAQSMADRYTYIPLIGVFVMVVWGLHETALRLRCPRGLVASGAALALTVLGIWSHAQTGRWVDSVHLFEHAVANSTGNWVAHNNLGSALTRRGQPEAALGHYQTAVEIAPGYADARYNLAALLSRIGRHDEAIRQYRKVLARSPGHAGALNNLCGELIAAGELEEGIANCRSAIVIDPGFANAHNNLAVALTRLGRRREAIGHYRRALELDPENPDAHLALGKLLAAEKEAAEALRHFRVVFQQKPDDAQTCRQVGDILMRAGNSAAAAEFYAAALRAGSDDADTYNRLGVAFARLGQHNDAAVMFQVALRKDPGHGAAADNLRKSLSGR